MDRDGGVEVHDWEVLCNSSDSGSIQDRGCLDEIERDSEGIIRSDYFSLDFHSHSHSHSHSHAKGEDDISIESDNPGWIDPVCDPRYSRTKEVEEFWSSGDGSYNDAGKYDEFEANNQQLDIVETAKRQADYDLSEMRLWSASGEIESEPRKYEKIDHVESEPSGEEKIVEARGDLGESEDVYVVEAGDDERNRGAVWWKLPLDLLKYCLFRATPVWTLSVAAAVMGLVILGRRLYKMKRKNRTLQLKVALDDKKVTQLMSRTARLNEAFSVVKQRVPIIRLSLPAAGVAPRSIMTLR